MEIVTGNTGWAHVTPIDDAIRNTATGYYNKDVVFDAFDKFAAEDYTNNVVTIKSGYGMMWGRYFKIKKGEVQNVTIRNGKSGMKRADFIVARYTWTRGTGLEAIDLAVIEGEESATEYIDPVPTRGNINEGAEISEFPLYRVKKDGLDIVAVEPLFEPLPDGGRLGEFEQMVDDVEAHMDNIDAKIDEIPKDIQDAASQEWVDDNYAKKTSLNGYSPVVHRYSPNGTGYQIDKASYMGSASMYGHVCISDSMNSALDNKSGVAATPKAVQTAYNDLDAKITQLKQDFMAGCNAIATSLTDKGFTPTKSGENYTPDEFIEAIDRMLASRKRAVNYSITETRTETSRDNTYIYYSGTCTVKVGGTTKTFTGTSKALINSTGGGKITYNQSWTQNV